MFHALTPILLTGATGLIGGELLRALLACGSRNITAIARPLNGDDAETRVLERLQRCGAEVESTQGRLRVVAGDMRRPDLGVDRFIADRLRHEAGIILHSASETSFIRDQECDRTNIDGMRHLIEFARGCARPPLVVYISTAANSGMMQHRCLGEDEGCNPEAPHHNEYTRSKALAERMLAQSGLPHLVLRPSIVLSAGLEDHQFARAIVWFIPLLNEFDAVPVDPESRLDIVPVSFVVDATLELLRRPDRRQTCYHLSAGPEQSMSCAEVAEFINMHYGREKPLELVPPSKWTREMHRRHVRTAEQRKIFSTLSYYLPFMNMDVVYDSTRLLDELGAESCRVLPFTSYLGDLLRQISAYEAMAEAANP